LTLFDTGESCRVTHAGAQPDADRLQRLPHSGEKCGARVLHQVPAICDLDGVRPPAGCSLGVHAVDLIAEGRFDRMVAWQNRCVVDVPLPRRSNGRSRWILTEPWCALPVDSASASSMSEATLH
jgi:hypothetical protein